MRPGSLHSNTMAAIVVTLSAVERFSVWRRHTTGTHGWLLFHRKLVYHVLEIACTIQTIIYDMSQVREFFVGISRRSM